MEVALAPSQVAPEPAVQPPPGNPRFPHVDVLRAVAVACVFLSHAFTAWWSAYLNIGVAMFFAISGFLLYRPFVAARLGASPQIDLRAYFIRRALRILPAYWLILIVLALLASRHGRHVASIWKNFIFVQNYSPHTLFNWIPGAWSLSVEVSFYLALPLVAVLVATRTATSDPRRAIRIELSFLGLGALLAVAFRAGFDAAAHKSVFGYATLPGTALFFIAGMTLAVLSVAGESVRNPFTKALDLMMRHPGALVVTAVALFVVLNVPFSNPAAFDPVRPPHPSPWLDVGRYLLQTSIAACVLVAAVSWAGPRSRISSPPGRVVGWLGVISYGIFLWHQKMLDEAVPRISPSGIAIAVAAVATVGCAAASYYFVERPLLKRKPGTPRV
jgi:peptidoglycan/LPS O-acetylase OafA/YrhL